MKKILCFAALLLLVLSLSACIGTEKPPVTTTDVPVSSDTEPTVTTTKPVVTTVEPVVTTAEPVVTTAEPVVTTAEPVVTTAEPVVTTAEPVVTTAEPVVTTAVSIDVYPVPVTTAPPVTTTPPETTAFDFAKSDLSEYIQLGKYLGIEVHVPAPEPVSEEAVEASIEEALAGLPREAMVYTRACQMGDKVNINFGGGMYEDLFEEGVLQNYTLLLDENFAIPGFAAAVAGMIPGDVLTFTLTFPDDYYAGLAGRRASFTVTLNYIYPTLTDAIAVSYFGAASAAAYRDKIRGGFAAEIESAFAEEKEKAAWTKALANSCILQYPEARVNAVFENNVAVYTAFAEMNGMTYEELFPTFYGLSVADAEGIMLESSKNIVAQQLLLYAIARDMGIDVSDERFDQELEATAAILGLGSVDALLEQLGGTRDTLKQDKLYTQVISAIVAQAKFVLINQ